MLSARRFAIVRRMLETGISSPGVIVGPAATGAAAGTRGAGGASAHDSMSRLMIRPLGPLPATAWRGMLRWAAMLRASGLAFTRPPSAATGAGTGRGPGAGGGAAAGGAGTGDAAAAGCGDAAAAAGGGAGGGGAAAGGGGGAPGGAGGAAAGGG